MCSGCARSLELASLRPISLLTGKKQGKIADFAVKLAYRLDFRKANRGLREISLNLLTGKLCSGISERTGTNSETCWPWFLRHDG